MIMLFFGSLFYSCYSSAAVDVKIEDVAVITDNNIISVLKFILKGGENNARE